MRIGVVIRTKDDYWSVTRFADEESLDQFVETVKKELVEEIKDINLVQLDPNCPIPPPATFNVSLEDLRVFKQFWCPWCGEIRSFAPSEEYPGDLFCTICHISTDDFYVRKFNRLDYLNSINPDGSKKKKRSRKQRERSKQNDNN